MTRLLRNSAPRAVHTGGEKRMDDRLHLKTLPGLGPQSISSMVQGSWATEQPPSLSMLLHVAPLHMSSFKRDVSMPLKLWLLTSLPTWYPQGGKYGNTRHSHVKTALDTSRDDTQKRAPSFLTGTGNTRRNDTSGGYGYYMAGFVVVGANYACTSDCGGGLNNVLLIPM
ncbi:hypothetical protein BC629DRAFT_1440900 [Irpex lacteus]|nr:hypothetical protein BC629DRAFT_1440900 [Irpex lacteus]